MNCDEHSAAREYSVFATAMGNLPYTVMILLGSGVVWVGLKHSCWAHIAGGAYLVYGAMGVFWIVCFLCPHCPCYATRSCPCGYGMLSAKLRPKGDTSLFANYFKKHIAAIVPLWFIPVIVGGAQMLNSFAWPTAILLGVFVLHSFVVFPLVSRSHRCKTYRQGEACSRRVHKQ